MKNPLWDRFIPPQNIKNYLSDTVEIGYSQYGMTLGVTGTITAAGKFTFITNMSIELLTKSSRYIFVFDWLAFRPIQFGETGVKGSGIKTASKFMVTEGEPYKYNIVFADQLQYATINPIIKEIRKGWDALTAENAALSTPQNPTQLFENFLQRKEIVHAQAVLRNQCYWRAEPYTLKLNFSGKSGQKIHEDIKTFILTAEDIKKMEINPIATIADLCKLPGIPYAFLKVPLNNIDS